MSQKKFKQQRKLARQHKLFYGSSYDRGLDILLFIWPDIKKAYPDAELHVCYGWELFNKIAGNNPERMQWKKSVESMMSQEGVIHHGRVGQRELAKIRESCGIWAYPTYFTEINCITALEAQADGLVPVTMTLAALSETVGAGVKIEGDIRNYEVQEQYLKALLEIMEDAEKWQGESEKAKEFAKNYTWDKIANLWLEEFKIPAKQPLVSVCTITIREGWWNIMAENLSRQTYKNFEWIIVDDYKEDRSQIAKNYAEKYNLTIRYLRGGKGGPVSVYPRRYGLARANNIAWREARGELLVYLQDFILIPERGIEDLVTLYNHHPNSLLAPVDQYWFAKKPDLSNKEDWWNGDTDIVDKFSWRNVRMQFAGIRKTDNPMDFEMNYGAIPKRILEELNGWWEFFDDGLGFDNTEIAFRALKAGYSILVDDTNVAKCINLWPIIGGTDQNIPERERHLSIPYYAWMINRVEKWNFPIVRDEKLDNSIKLEFEVPSEIEDKDCSDWIRTHAEEIVEGWGES